MREVQTKPPIDNPIETKANIEQGFKAIEPKSNISMDQVTNFLKNIMSRDYSEDKPQDSIAMDTKPDNIDNAESSLNKIENTESGIDLVEHRKKGIEDQEKGIRAVENGKETLESNQQRGNYGEMKTDQNLRSLGYERISLDITTDTNQPGHRGIDGVYRNPDGTQGYIVVDAKYGSAKLSGTLDGKQMSEKWIDNRLDESVGKEMADEIRMEKIFNPDNVGMYVSHISSSGDVTYDKLDDEANVIKEDVKING